MDNYKMIRQQIINDIERGVYAPGDTIPKQTEFAEQYQVSRGTIRKALDDLLKKGVLISVKGRGTVVAEFNSSSKDTYRPLSFSSSKRVEQNELKSKVISCEYINAEPWLAKLLEVPVGAEVVYLKRVRILNGIPENYQCSYMSVQKLGGLKVEEIDLEKESLFHKISETTGLYAMKKNEELRAVRCPGFVAEELNLQANDPVLLIMRTVYSQDQMPLEYCEDYECTDVKGPVFTTEGTVEREKILDKSNG